MCSTELSNLCIDGDGGRHMNKMRGYLDKLTKTMKTNSKIYDFSLQKFYSHTFVGRIYCQCLEYVKKMNEFELLKNK